MYSLRVKHNIKLWQKNKLRHRSKDLPAVEFDDGYKCWYKHGIRYEIIEYFNGTKEWHKIVNNVTNHYMMYRNENNFSRKLHSFDGPAIIYPNGDYEYWCNGRRHRLDGPAVIIGNNQYWFYYGEFIKCIV